ncbi:MAG: UvrD-helicase domain-containing protein, partial [Phycisphaerae bacterium]
MVRSALAFAPEIGLPPAWRIADAAEDQTLRVDAIEKVLHDHLGRPGPGKSGADAPVGTSEESAGTYTDGGVATPDEGLRALLDLLVLLNQGAFPRTVLASLGESFAATYETFLGSAPEAWNQPSCTEVALEPQALAAYLKPLPEKLSAFVPLTGKGQPNANWVKAIAKLLAAAGTNQWNALAEMALFANSRSPGGSYYRAPIPEGFSAALAPLCDHVRATLTTQLRHSNLALRGLLTAFDRTYRAGKFRGGAYRFEDFARLLDESQVRAGSDTFYYRLDGQIDHLLLDEFQDTSVAQWRFLEPLALEIAAGSTGALQRPRSFFCVGDVKQSLYGWRNAERGLFAALPEILHEVDQQTLAQSRRSAPKVIETVNAVFADLPGNRLIQTRGEDQHLVGAAAEWHRDFAPHTAYKKTPPGHCTLRTCQAGESVEEKRSGAIKLAAERVAALLAANPHQEIAVLFRNTKAMAGLLEQLRQRHIPATGEGGSPLTDDPAVCCALSLLHLVDHPSDTAAAFHVATSPLGAALGLADNAPPQQVVELTEQIRRDLLDRGLPAVLNTWRGLIAAPPPPPPNPPPPRGGAPPPAPCPPPPVHAPSPRPRSRPDARGGAAAVEQSARG